MLCYFNVPLVPVSFLLQIHKKKKKQQLLSKRHIQGAKWLISCDGEKDVVACAGIGAKCCRGAAASTVVASTLNPKALKPKTQGLVLK